jgi:hypothetical protein
LRINPEFRRKDITLEDKRKNKIRPSKKKARSKYNNQRSEQRINPEFMRKDITLEEKRNNKTRPSKKKARSKYINVDEATV